MGIHLTTQCDNKSCRYPNLDPETDTIYCGDCYEALKTDLEAYEEQVEELKDENRTLKDRIAEFEAEQNAA